MTPSKFCTECGSPALSGAQFCSSCGAHVLDQPQVRGDDDPIETSSERQPADADRTTVSVNATTDRWPRSQSRWAQAGPGLLPIRLWVVIGLISLVGVAIAIPSLYLLFTSLPLLAVGGEGTLLGVFVLVLLAIPLVFGLGCLYLARRIQQGDRVARVLAIALCAAGAAACFLTDARDIGWVIAGLLALGAAALLGFDPVVIAHFRGDDATHGAEPSAVVAARTMMVFVAACVLMVGVMFIPLGVYAPSLFAYGSIDVAISLGIFYLSRRLAAGEATARVVSSGVALVYLVNSVIAGHGQPGVILPVGLALCVVGLLWLPPSSRQYFGTLQRPRQPLVAAVERLVDSFVGAAFAVMKGSTPTGGSGA